MMYSFLRNFARRPTFKSLAVLLAAALNTAVAQAIPLQALDFTGGTEAVVNANSTYGWGFRLSTTITVTELGFFDLGGNGLFNSHQVGLWSESISGATLLASATIPSGTGTTAVVSGSGLGSFRYVPVAPLVLTPGDYALGAHYGNDDWVLFFTEGGSLASGFEYNFGRLAIGMGFVYPETLVIDNGGRRSYFGPNLRFDVVDGTAIPEPATIALLGLGFAGLAAIRRKRS